MNEEKELVLRGLVKEAGRVYSRLGMMGLESWVYSGNGDKNYRNQIYEIICKRNSSPSRSIFSLDSTLEKEILNKILKNGKNN